VTEVIYGPNNIKRKVRVLDLSSGSEQGQARPVQAAAIRREYLAQGRGSKHSGDPDASFASPATTTNLTGAKRAWACLGQIIMGIPQFHSINLIVI
jgi:hypothetical protein